MKVLIVVDMQNDFIDGALGTEEAVAIVPNVIETIKGFEGTILYTKDTHFDDYMDTQEGKNLPVPHCIKGTDGWNLAEDIEAVKCPQDKVFEKMTFGSKSWETIYRDWLLRKTLKKLRWWGCVRIFVLFPMHCSLKRIYRKYRLLYCRIAAPVSRLKAIRML